MTGSSGSKSSVSETPAAPSATEIHLWLCRSAEIGAESDHARALLFRLLDMYFPERAGHWQLEASEKGRPFLRCGTLDFNFSHSGGLIACALTGGSSIGVDLEPISSARAHMRLARRYFAAAELAFLEGLEDEEQLTRFFDLWTLKEAHTKARGSTIATSMASSAFDLSIPGCIRPCFEAAESTGFWLFEVQPGWRLALCQLEVPPGGVQLQVFETGESVGSEPLELPLVAVTAGLAGNP